MCPTILFAILGVAAIVRYVILKGREILMNSESFISRHFRQGHDAALLIIAHPDDECLFFTPVIRCLVRDGIPVHILCLSTGDFEGKGEIRSLELQKSCRVLGVECTQMNDPNFPDGPSFGWNPEDISRTVESCLSTTAGRKYTTLITFDQNGVSSHPNHMATNAGVRRFLERGTNSSKYWLLELESVSIWEKYATIGPLSLALELARHMLLPAGISKGYLANQRVIAFISAAEFLRYGVGSMKQHQSQLKWFRLLYLIASRYMHTNSLIVRNSPTKSSA